MQLQIQMQIQLICYLLTVVIITANVLKIFSYSGDGKHSTNLTLATTLVNKPVNITVK